MLEIIFPLSLIDFPVPRLPLAYVWKVKTIDEDQRKIGKANPLEDSFEFYIAEHHKVHINTNNHCSSITSSLYSRLHHSYMEEKH